MRLFKDICNSRGEYAPHKIQLGGYICHPSKSKWEVLVNNLYILAKLLHAV